MNYGPHMQTFKREKNRIIGQYYWFNEKNNNYSLRFWNGKKLTQNKEKKKQYYEKNKEKHAERTKKYYEKNKGKISEKTKEWYEKNKGKVSNYKKEWREKNKDRLREKKKEYRKNNRMMLAKMEKDWYEKNKERVAERGKEYREKNKEKCRERSKKYREKNRERLLKKKKEYYQKNREKMIKKSREWDKNNREKRNKRERDKRTNDPRVRIEHILRTRIGSTLKANGAKKNKRSMEYYSCTVEHFYNYIEILFTDGMSWDNQGKKAEDRRGWQLDHRRPCASFNFNNEDEIYMCFHWTNYQPLWASDNNKKSDKYDTETFGYEWKGREVGWVKKT